MSLDTEYQQYIHASRYARWLPEAGRRETWEETVTRYMDFMQTQAMSNGYQLDEHTYHSIKEAIYDLEVMPSMRCMATAGEALARDNIAGFNCSYVAVDNPRIFDEVMYVLMCGTGVGFSVERQYVNKLPEVAEAFHETDTRINVADSKTGWARAFRELVSLLYSGQVPFWDISSIRAAGLPLKVFGGRASGPEPLVELFKFTVSLFKNAAGRRLTSIECHDLMCKIAEVVVVGGVRRSALISLSNLSDDRMRSAKSGQWWDTEPQRALANNSAVYTEKPDFQTFLHEWSSLYESKSGERGIFSRAASQVQAAKNGRRDPSYEFGTNPCSEIILRPNQFCNLSEVVVRSGDTLEDLRNKVKVATILGTLQASLTDFRYLRAIWKKNTEEECLLGVSLTGIMDHTVLNGTEGSPEELADVLEELKALAVKTNAEWANKLGINPSTAITCVKPSGTVSQLVDSASGIHSRFSPCYIRRVRADVKDPLTTFMIDKGYPCEQDNINPNNKVFSFPIKAPEGSHFVKDDSVKQQLDIWKIYQDHWCEHKPSVTVYYSDSEFLSAGDWVYNNFDSVSGVSFLPRSDHTYAQAPYEAIDEAAYEELLSQMPKDVDWKGLSEYEKEDNTVGVQTLACTAGACEI